MFCRWLKNYGAVLVALCLDDSGIPATAAGRIAVAEKIYRPCGRIRH